MRYDSLKYLVYVLNVPENGNIVQVVQYPQLTNKYPICVVSNMGTYGYSIHCFFAHIIQKVESALAIT